MGRTHESVGTRVRKRERAAGLECVAQKSPRGAAGRPSGTQLGGDEREGHFRCGSDQTRWESGCPELGCVYTVSLGEPGMQEAGGSDAGLRSGWLRGLHSPCHHVKFQEGTRRRAGRRVAAWFPTGAWGSRCSARVRLLAGEPGRLGTKPPSRLTRVGSPFQRESVPCPQPSRPANQGEQIVIRLATR